MEIQELSHITLIVKDIQKTAKVFCDIFGAKEIYDSKSKNYSISREKYFLVGNLWIVIMEGESTERSYRHIAFRVAEKDLPILRVKLEELGCEIKPSRARIEGEGKSLYFYDYDNNLYELHSGTLQQRLKKYEL
ncbi:MAG: FosX/FosE/FosI family fosfomycin resistance hydrolase [Desulfobacteraceae bacterium]|nr:FosX/FosE/FosI family fosfomycin resistance hydrolase [Desulfobacteraceae bacterium]